MAALIVATTSRSPKSGVPITCSSAADGDAFHVLDETGAIEESAEAEEDAAPGAWPDATSPGEEWTACAVGVSLAARYAVINLDCYAQYEDGTVRIPDVESFTYSDRTGERVDTFQHLEDWREVDRCLS